MSVSEVPIVTDTAPRCRYTCRLLQPRVHCQVDAQIMGYFKQSIDDDANDDDILLLRCSRRANQGSTVP